MFLDTLWLYKVIRYFWHMQRLLVGTFCDEILSSKPVCHLRITHFFSSFRSIIIMGHFMEATLLSLLVFMGSRVSQSRMKLKDVEWKAKDNWVESWFLWQSIGHAWCFICWGKISFILCILDRETVYPREMLITFNLNHYCDI